MGNYNWLRNWPGGFKFKRVAANIGQTSHISYNFVKYKIIFQIRFNFVTRHISIVEDTNKHDILSKKQMYKKVDVPTSLPSLYTTTH